MKNLGYSAIALAALIAAPALSETVCASRDEVMDALSGKYEESRVAQGMTYQGWFLEMFASEAGSWSAVITYPSGKSCIAASGQAFEAMAPVYGDKL